VVSGGTADGTRVQPRDRDGSGAQRWAVSAAHDVVNPQADKCLAVTGDSSADGTRPQICHLYRSRRPEVDGRLSRPVSAGAR
jgi:hypothetical protein